MRNMTYSSEIFADIKFSKKELDNFYEIDMLTGQRKRKVKQTLEVFETAKVEIGRIPVMLRSNFCQLKSMNEYDRVKNGKDCVFD